MQRAKKHTVTVIDLIMGSGKTTHLINHLNSLGWRQSGAKVIFITPTLNEVDRITQACPILKFRNPLPVHGKKYWDFMELIDAGENICTTHSLFRRLDRKAQSKLKEHGYSLVIDEALDVVELYTDLSPQDLSMLKKDGWVTVEEDTGLLKWDESRPYFGKHSGTMDLCLNGSLVSQGEKLILWEFPISFLDCFKDVTVLTYLFHGSMMAAYLAAGGVEFNMKAIHGGHLVDWYEVDERAIKERLRGLIKVYEGKANAVGDTKAGEQPLSASWYQRQARGDKAGLVSLKKGLHNFFINETKTASAHNLWTTFKNYKGSLKGKGYGKGFVPNNLRATNEFKHKRSAAYTCNTFMHPVVKGYLKSRGVPVYEELYSLSELLQWVWRTAIREYQPINVFVPSERMRGLLKAWLDSDATLDLFARFGLEAPTQTSANAATNATQEVVKEAA